MTQSKLLHKAGRWGKNWDGKDWKENCSQETSSFLAIIIGLLLYETNEPFTSDSECISEKLSSDFSFVDQIMGETQGK